MDAKRFLYEFYNAINDDYDVLLSLLSKDKSFTSEIFDLLSTIIEKEGFCCGKEYYRIDLMGYDDKKNVQARNKETKFKNYIWDLKIAIEHENDSFDWNYEVMKMMNIICSLKVVIGYVKEEERINGIEEKRLKFVSDNMKKLECYKECKKLRQELLVILGLTCHTNKIDYVGYLFNYDSEKFEKIDN